MKRRVMQFAAAVSLLMCVVTLALWVRSYWRRDDLRVFPSTQRYWLLRSAEGRLNVQQTWASGPFWIASVREYSSGKAGGVSYANLPFQWRVAGFGYGQLTTPSGLGPTLTAHVYLMPHAFAAIVFGAAPLWWLVGLRPHTRRARLAAGLCAECGYDLRASADRCPECGAANPRAI